MCAFPLASFASPTVEGGRDMAVPIRLRSSAYAAFRDPIEGGALGIARPLCGFG